MNKLATALFGFGAGAFFLRASQVTPKAPTFGIWLFVAIVLLSLAFVSVIRE
jgi:uncharacterized iron-regulated membrane protein